MNTRTRTLSAVWTVFRSQFQLLGSVLLVCCAAQLVSVLSLSLGYGMGRIGTRDVVALPRVLGTIWMMLLVITMLNRSDTPDSPDFGFPRRLYRMPIRLELAALTVLFARILIVLAMASVVYALHSVPGILAPQFNRHGLAQHLRSDEYLNLWQSLLFATAWCIFIHTAAWRLGSRRPWGTIAVVVLMITSLFCLNEWDGYLALIYTGGSVAAIIFGLNGLRLERCGAYSDDRTLRERVASRFASREMKGPREFASPLHAQAWLEQRSYVRLVIPTLLVCGAISCVLSSVKITRGIEVVLQSYTIALPFAFIIAAAVAGGFRAAMLRSKTAATTFVMVRPISAPDLACSRMWASVAALSKAALLGLLIAIVAFWICIAANQLLTESLRNLPFSMWPVGAYAPAIVRQLMILCVAAWACFWLGTREAVVMLAIAALALMLNVDQPNAIAPIFVVGTIVAFVLGLRRRVILHDTLKRTTIFFIALAAVTAIEIAEVQICCAEHTTMPYYVTPVTGLAFVALGLLPVASTALEAARGRGR